MNNVFESKSQFIHIFSAVDRRFFSTDVYPDFLVTGRLELNAADHFLTRSLTMSFVLTCISLASHFAFVLFFATQ